MSGELNPPFHKCFDLRRNAFDNIDELVQMKRTRFSILVFTQAQDLLKRYVRSLHMRDGSTSILLADPFKALLKLFSVAHQISVLWC